MEGVFDVLGDAPEPSGAVQIAGGDVQAYRYNALEPNGFDRTVTVSPVPMPRARASR